MDQMENIWAALRKNESRDPSRTPKVAKKHECHCRECGADIGENDLFCKQCGATQEDAEPALENHDPVCECGAALVGDEKFCPQCGKSLLPPANEEDEDDPEDNDDPEEIDLGDDPDLDDPEDSDDPAPEGEDDPEDDDPEEIDPEKNEGRKLRLKPYNEDVVKYMGQVLKEQKAPVPVMKAFEGKMYERCATWLRTARDIDIDPTEGFTANEDKQVRQHLKAVKAPKAIFEAYNRGQYSVVAAYLKSHK